MRRSVLILSTADWDQPLWTNKQHLAVHLARRDLPVTYVESLGLRRPALRGEDLARGLRRLTRGLRSTGDHVGARPVPDRVTVVSPLVVPLHRGPAPVLAWNRRALHRAVAPWLAAPRDCRVLWTFSPVTYGLEEQAAATVYHAVDLLGGFPGVDARMIDAGERRLASHGAVAVASSAPIAEHLDRQGFAEVRTWENVADTTAIEAAAQGQQRQPAAVFAGNLTTHKVDFALLRQLVEEVADLHLHLAGPVAEGGGERPDLSFFADHPRVTLHGVVPPERLGALLGRCTVGLVPYLDTPYTRGVFPMKLYEYLAAGLAVVSTPLPSLHQPPGHVTVEPPERFVGRVRALAPVPTDDVLTARREAARERSWTGRGADAAGLIDLLSPDCR